MRREYAFDYSKARPNRFAARLKGIARTVVLDPDIAVAFPSSKSVNATLRSTLVKKRAVAARRSKKRKAG